MKYETYLNICLNTILIFELLISKNNHYTAIKPVLSYLEKQNRPYSVIDIFNNLHKTFSKSIVIKVLEVLVSQVYYTAYFNYIRNISFI